MLDLAERRWPDVGDRRALLLLLAAAGRDAISGDLAPEKHEVNVERQKQALSRARTLIDLDALMADAAWR
jgi:hypothetical protein